VKDASECGIWCCDVSAQERSSFIVPASVRRGQLIISVTTSGASPGLSRKIRMELEQSYGEEYELLLNILAKFRVEVMELIGDKKLRAMIFQSLLKSDILEIVRSGAADRLQQQLSEAVHKNYSWDQWEQLFDHIGTGV
jgi:precorrin-2 dehydrogenase/sirohydrochlorin ferrochelatase